jgi:hypothetical protein
MNKLLGGIDARKWCMPTGIYCDEGVRADFQQVDANNRHIMRGAGAARNAAA